MRKTYVAIFHTYLIYVSTVWGKTRTCQNRVTVIQKNSVKIINFPPFHAHSSAYFHGRNILNFCNIVNIEAYFLINNCFSNNSFSVFPETFRLVTKSQARNAR